MGKAALILVFGTVLYVSVSQMSSKDTQDGVSDANVEFQENTLASEIARSAFAMAQRRANAIQASADSVVAVLNGHSGKTTGTYQGGTYEFSASKSSDSMVMITAKGFFGDESHTLERTYSIDYIPETSWNYGCGASGANFVDIEGIGLGSKGKLINNGGTVTFADTSNIVYMKAQVGGRVNLVKDVTFESSAGESFHLTKPDTIGISNMGYFQADLTPASQVRVHATVNSKNNGARGFVVYAHRDLPIAMHSEGRYLDVRGYHYGHTENFQIPTASAPRTINVDYVFYDKDHSRTLTMTLQAGTQTETRTISTPSEGSELSIETMTLNNVPGDVKNVVVSIYTNDSIYWKMAHLYTDGCS